MALNTRALGAETTVTAEAKSPKGTVQDQPAKGNVDHAKQKLNKSLMLI